MNSTLQTIAVFITAIGTIIAAIIAGIWILFNNRIQKKLEFIYDFDKFILDKRKVAYDGIENMFTLIHHGKNYTDFIIACINADRKDLQAHGLRIKSAIETVNKENIWYTSQLSDNLHVYHSMLNEVLRKGRDLKETRIAEESTIEDLNN